MEKSEVCPDTSKPSIRKKPRVSSNVTKRRRFKPRLLRKSLTDSVLEVITDPYKKTNEEARDRCFRLNGEMMRLPQNKEEDQLMDKTLRNYQLKRADNNLTQLIDDGSVTWIMVAAATKLVDKEMRNETFKEMDSREQTFPPNGKLDLNQKKERHGKTTKTHFA